MSTPHDDALPTNPASPSSAAAAPSWRPSVRTRAWAGTVLLVLVSVATGVWLDRQAQGPSRATADPAAPAPPGAPLGLGGPVTLRGPEATVTLPLSTPAVVHVFTPSAVAAQPQLVDLAGAGMEVPVVHVAVGGASLAWARAHGVAGNLVVDPAGTALARPLGVTSFTTLVLDERGAVRFSDRPDNPGFAERLAGALRALHSSPAAARRL